MVHVAPIKPSLKAHGSKLLRLNEDELLSNFGFKFNVRHYNLRSIVSRAADGWGLHSYTFQLNLSRF